MGKALSTAFGVPFVDLDQYIEEREGRSISHIFAEDGEEYFRRVEHEALLALMEIYRGRPAVISLGGGTPCRNGVMEIVNRFATSVYLEVSMQKLTDRLIENSSSRPIIAGKSPSDIADTVIRMLASRAPFYRLAKYTFDASNLESDKEIAESVANFTTQIIKKFTL